MRPVPAVALACVLSACAGANVAPIAGEWKVSQRADRVGEAPSEAAFLVSRSRNTRADIDKPGLLQVVSLQLMCFDGEPVVKFYFTQQVGSNLNSRFTYKFDNTSGTKPDARILRDLKTVLLENKNDVVTFVTALREAKKLDVMVSGLLAGTTVAELNVEGAAVAIDASYKTCPLPAAPPPRAPARRARAA